MVELEFSLDPETGLPHFLDHGVTEEEVRQILAHPGMLLRGFRKSRLALGQTEAGRYLKVIYAPRRHGPGKFVITAYDLSKKERRAYRRQMWR